METGQTPYYNVLSKISRSRRKIMKNELIELLRLLSDTEYRTASELAERLGVSPKTVRTRLKELGNEGRAYGVTIGSKPRFGYILLESENDGILRLEESLSGGNGLPDSTSERTDYLLVYLLNHADYTKLEVLCDFLCVSRSTLQNSVKEVEEILNRYELQIDRKPGYGICVKGNEFDIRRCIGECFVKRNMLSIGEKFYSAAELEYLAGMIFELTEKYKISLSANAYEDLITQIYVAMKRMKHGCRICFQETYDQEKYQIESRVASELAERIREWQKIEYDPNEIQYILIYLAGNRMVGGSDQESGNFVIREEIDRLVVKMLELIYDEYRIELRNNFSLRMALNQHMVPFDIRMRYNIRIKNPILDEIKQNYVFGYTLAQRSAVVLEKFYSQSIPDSELGYFAMLFVYALEQGRGEIEKARILIVCGAGRATSMFLKYKFEQEFGEYLEKIYVCGLHELSKFDFEKIDYVFATVPIQIRIPKPITEVGQFLGGPDILKVRRMLEKGRMDFLDDYYKKEQFFTDIGGDTKEEVICNICARIQEQRGLPEGFCDAVLKREELAQTDFGNLISMPHPYKIVTEETFVYVAVLEKEILWTKNPVQLVFLTAVSGREDKNLPRFYEVTTEFFLQSEMIKTVIREKDFEVLMQMLRQIYYMQEH